MSFQLQGTVTGRFKSSQLPLWNWPTTGAKNMSQITNKVYLFRNMELIFRNEGTTSISMEAAHRVGQAGDVCLVHSYMGTYRMYFWRGAKKHYWRPVSGKKKPELLASLKMALMLQS